MPDSTPNSLAGGKFYMRGDAIFVLKRLREAGHVAYFAGGCVRDLLLEREPKDWDVATDAPPGRVRELFRHTQAVGAAFGVILVHHRGSQIEVATFRSDGQYQDGRRPDSVHFTTAEEDSRRRDFTINGLFLDPLAQTSDSPHGRIIDFVGGRQDLTDRRLRAIGDPAKRFDEDHLRLLRAVRFAARFGFTIEPATSAAIKTHAPMLTRISPERVADELRVMLPQPTRSLAWRLLNEHDLAQVIFRFIEIPTGDPDETRGIDAFFSRLAPGEPLPFSLSLAAVTLQWAWWASPASVGVRHWLAPPVAHRLMRGLRKALRLSNQECEEVEQILAGLSPIVAENRPTLATLKRFLARPTNAGSRLLMAALAEAGLIDEPLAESLLADLLELEQTDFAPTPLITGDDLTAIGLPPGPKFRSMLDAAYDAQLEGQITTREEAIEIARKVGSGQRAASGQ